MKSCALLCLSLLFATAYGDDTELNFVTQNGQIKLAGTMTLPENKPLLALVMLSVAGPTDRDLTLGPHKYFAELASGLAAKGIASLRYDDRGTGASTGDFLQSSLDDRARDACAARDKLAEAANLPLNRVGFLGLSEGSGLTLVAAQYCTSIPFRVMLSPPVRTGIIEMQAQMYRLLETSTFTEKQKQGIKSAANEFLSMLTAKPLQREGIHTLLAGPYGQAILPPYGFVPKGVAERTDFVMSPWYQSQVHYDLNDAFLAAEKTPILVIYGGKDTVIDIAANQQEILKKMPHAKVEYLPEMNHLMQVAITGSPLEYAQLPEGFSIAVLELIGDWVVQQFQSE